MTIPVYVVMSAYGAERVRQSGQSAFIGLAAGAGADGVEIRRELFDGASRPLTFLREQLRNHALQAVYSAPEAVFLPDATLAHEALRLALSEAETLGARHLKFSLGHYAPESPLQPLADALAGHPVRLLVENDQTAHGGSIERLRAFFDASAAAGIGVGMTFDIGNWYWSGQSPLEAAAALAPYVEYIHCKGAQPSPRGWRATVPEAGIGDWRGVLAQLPCSAPRGLEFPLQGGDASGLTRHYVSMLGIEGNSHE
ncbi:sugar phosphate isomerase/epimerase family protein [Paludibacterium yongneupense]|uniref:sugar phosphate isomerase/epimerase family protein n=1 Tax=Paludibacterium yongneupense TaxID=400061 RepID=UPI0004015406|nr:TIM barrel protein [Paludibacterium yongneupense]